jgi:hypothetical protein
MLKKLINVLVMSISVFCLWSPWWNPSVKLQSRESVFCVNQQMNIQFTRMRCLSRAQGHSNSIRRLRSAPEALWKCSFWRRQAPENRQVPQKGQAEFNFDAVWLDLFIQQQSFFGAQQHRIAQGVLFPHGVRVEMRVALKLLSVVIAEEPKSHFAAVLMHSNFSPCARPRRLRAECRSARVIRNFEQINAERHSRSDTRNTSPVISEGFKAQFLSI